jgi:hypothetical protein
MYSIYQIEKCFKLMNDYYFNTFTMAVRDSVAFAKSYSSQVLVQVWNI